MSATVQNAVGTLMATNSPVSLKSIVAVGRGQGCM
jgi:hypothetical protein